LAYCHSLQEMLWAMLACSWDPYFDDELAEIDTHLPSQKILELCSKAPALKKVSPFICLSCFLFSQHH
jgi:hypothetical protein